VKESPEEFICAIVEEFGQRRAFSLLETELHQYYQHQGESVRGVIRWLKDIQERYPDCDKNQLKSQFIQGLLSRNIQSKAVEKNANSFKTIVKASSVEEENKTYLEEVQQDGDGPRKRREKKIETILAIMYAQEKRESE